MKFKNFLFALALPVMALISACGDEDTPDNPIGDEIKVKTEVLLAGDAPQTLNIAAHTLPVLSSEAEWLHIGEVSVAGSGIYSTVLSADPNATGDDRSTDLNVTAGATKAIVKVTQKAGDVVIIRSVSPEGVLDAEGGTLVIAYAATDTPVASLPDWITPADTKSLDNGTMSFTFSANTSGNEREGEIVLSVGKTASASVRVSQDVRAVAELKGKTAAELAKMMYAGINIGNTMECPNGEGDWSMPVNEKYVEALAAMGFNAVRIPCAWDSHAKDGVIDADWLARVDEIVGWVIGNGMFALVNTHWDGGWIEGEPCKNYDAAIDAKFASYWNQIATQLNHYDQHLLFSALNEPPVDDKSTATKERSMDAIMKYEQTMLNTVRATGGNNADRVLVMSLPNTDFELGTTGYFHLPTDEIAGRLMVEGHFYGPYQFNMMEDDAGWGKTYWYWGKDNLVAGSPHNTNVGSYGDEDWLHGEFERMKKAFIDKGIPGITGEYCVCCNREANKDKYVGIDVDKWRASVRLWNKTVTMESKNAGLVPFFWETGQDINRRDGSVLNSLQLDGVFEGASLGKYPF